MKKIELRAPANSLLGPCLSEKPDLDESVQERIRALEEYDLGFLLLGLSPRRLLREGRLFDNEQVLPLMMHFAQWDKHCRYWLSEVFRQWLVFNPSKGELEGVPDEKTIAFRDYFFEKFAIPLIEEFRKFVALTILNPTEHNAPPGPVDMVWHAFLLNTTEYEEFSKKVWIGALHEPPLVPEESYR